QVFPCPVPDSDGCYLNRFFLHGVRHAPPGAIERIGRLQRDDPLTIAPEPENLTDSNAVAVFPADSFLRLGYVPRYLAHDAAKLLTEGGSSFVKLYVDRVNPDAPLQQRVLCRMRACWPDGFRPCSGDAFL